MKIVNYFISLIFSNEISELDVIYNPKLNTDQIISMIQQLLIAHDSFSIKIAYRDSESIWYVSREHDLKYLSDISAMVSMLICKFGILNETK